MIWRLVVGRILRLFQSILGLFKRALCIFRKRENIGELPTEIIIDRRATHSESDPPPSSTWSGEWDKKVMVESKIDEWRKTKAAPQKSPAQEEPDFFTDMTPAIKKTQKVIRVQRPQEKRNLFGFESDGVQVSAELGELDDTGSGSAAWGDDTELENALREHRADKHRARQAEHERQIQEKRQQKMVTGHY